MRKAVLPAPSAKARVAEALRAHIASKFSGNASEAARKAGITRAVLHSYTSEKNFPSEEAFNKFRLGWKLDLLSLTKKLGGSAPQKGKDRLSFLDSPMVLANKGVKLALKRKGMNVAVGIEISPDLKSA
jgi:hypothetical protein